MGTKDLLIDNSGDREAVEDIAKGFPELDIVPTTTLIVKAVDAVDACALMVSAEDEEVFRIADLESEQKANGLDTLTSTIDIIAQKEVVGVRGEAAILEETK